MNDPSVTDHFAAIAAELRRAADGIETLVGSGLRKPYFNLNIQPGTPGDGDSTAASVDAMGLALLGKRGRAAKMHDGTYHYNVEDTQRGPISLSIYQSVPIEWALKREAADALAEREAELEKLRAEVIALRAAAALQPDATAAWAGEPGLAAYRAADPSGLGYSREADDPTPVSGARMRHHESSGWKGTDPGSCGVECACGVTYDGFDSLKEAGEQLARHIETADAQERVAAKRQALQWRRAVTSHAGLTVCQAEQVARNTAHAVALDEDNDRAKREVERSMTARDAGRIANPNLARFLAEREDRSRYQRHYLGLEESAKHNTAEPGDGHVYECCGKVGRISRHEPWCDVYRTPDQSASAS